MMLYDVDADDKALFDSAYGYVCQHEAGGELAAWVTHKEEVAAANAVVDDLRISRVLCAAGKRWGGYDEDVEALSQALYQYCVEEGRLVDFYDVSAGAKASRLTLCYADFETLVLLAKAAPR
jgi:endo-1,4-beta-D-glucanase Y